MIRGSRACHATVPIIYIFAVITTCSSVEYGVPIEIKLWDTGRTPIAHMVDATNGFGLKVLAEHNFLNDNNIAFSPYGLMGILVALYEGVDGESSFQIQRAMQLPWNRNVMRVGFRDIHRTLKTYFVPEEGFLAGLALNNENVTFNESYKKVLRFYGFDLDREQLPTLPTQPNNVTNVTEATTATPTTVTPGPTTMVTTSTEAMASREEPSTTVSTLATISTNAEIVNDDVTQTTTTKTVATETTTQITTEQNSMETTAQNNMETTAQNNMETTAQNNMETTAQNNMETAGLNTMEAMTELTMETTLNNEGTATTTMPTTITEAMDIQSTISTSAVAEESTSTVSVGSTINNEVEILTTTNTDTSDATSTMATNSEMISTESTLTVTSAETVTLLNTAAIGSESTLETLQRRKKSIVDFLFTNPPYVDDYFIYRSYEIPIPDFPGAGTSYRGQGDMFLVNGLRNIQVSYMYYDTILDHAYLPHLDASALRLPLDSERYYLLVVLPSSNSVVDLGRLLARMARESDLSDVHAALRPRRVNAIVPSFTVKGHVTLTTDLQKLGIRDVFEPRQRDFTPMTGQPGVYVRSIEQAVSVAIRKYKSEDHKSNRFVHNRQPVKFSATYPFLYFVMDASIHVALMAGKMVDPLNNRVL